MNFECEFDKPGNYNRPYWVSQTVTPFDIYNGDKLITQPYCFDPVGIAETAYAMPFFPNSESDFPIPRVTAAEPPGLKTS
ncbi:MAG: hypothetical protein R3C28_20705 [Pirellulaceae bacterium]